MIEAGPNGCQEAALGFPGSYIPCNQPAVSIVGWKGRSDAPIRMCFGCKDHNIRNRGGEVVRPLLKPTASHDVDGPNDSGYYSAGIDLPLPNGEIHSHAIEVHDQDKDVAITRRNLLLRLLEGSL